MARSDTELLRHVAGALARVREEHGLTQRVLAERIGRPPSYVAKLELAEHRMDVADLVGVAEALELESTELLARLLSGWSR